MPRYNAFLTIVLRCGWLTGLLLIAGEWKAVGVRRALIAIALLLVAYVPLATAVRAVGGQHEPTWVLPIAFFGTCALALASGVVIPPGLAIPPPLWPVAVSGAVVAGFEFGPGPALGAGALTGAIPLLSAAFSVTSLTQEITAFEMALFLASIAPAALAGAVSSLVRPRAAPVPRAPEAPATEERVDEAPASEAGASD